jgi:hypothetical protein
MGWRDQVPFLWESFPRSWTTDQARVPLQDSPFALFEGWDFSPAEKISTDRSPTQGLGSSRVVRVILDSLSGNRIVSQLDRQVHKGSEEAELQNY